MPKSLPRLAGVPCFLFQGQRCAGQPVQHNDRGVQQDKPSKQPMQRRLQPNGTHISRLFNSFRFHLLVSFCGVFKKVKRANSAKCKCALHFWAIRSLFLVSGRSNILFLVKENVQWLMNSTTITSCRM